MISLFGRKSNQQIENPRRIDQAINLLEQRQEYIGNKILAERRRLVDMVKENNKRAALVCLKCSKLYERQQFKLHETTQTLKEQKLGINDSMEWTLDICDIMSRSPTSFDEYELEKELERLEEEISVTSYSEDIIPDYLRVPTKSVTQTQSDDAEERALRALAEEMNI